MKKFLLISAFFVSAFTATAQWAVQNTSFTQVSRGIREISIVNDNVAYASAYDGSGGGANVRQITYTLDGGATWTPRSIAGTGIVAALEAANVSAVNDSTAYVSLYPTTNAQGGIWRTTNYGVTWARQPSAAFTSSLGGFVNFVHMFNQNDGIAQGDPVGGYFEIYTTIDGGVNWVRVPQANIPAPNAADEYGTIGYFGTSGDNIWFSTSKGRMFRSFNKGLTWAVSTPGFGVAASISGIAFKDANNGILIATSATNTNLGFVTTSDGGATWSAPNTTVTGGLGYKNDISYVPGTTGTYVITSVLGAGSGSAFTEDDGATWTNIDLGIQYTAVQFFSPTRGYAGGFNGPAASVGGISEWDSDFTPIPTTTNVTFQADMTALLAAGFNPASDSIKALIFTGSPVGGTDGVRMTPTANPNIYQVVRQVPIGGFIEWKFRALGTTTFDNSGYEGGNNRTFTSGNDTTIGPIVPLITITPTPAGFTQVTFQADMTALFAAGFSPTTDSIKALIFTGSPVGGTDGVRMVPTSNPSIYQVIRSVADSASVNWKFRAFGSSAFGNSGYESGNDRNFIANNDTIIGPIAPLINIIPPSGRNVTFLADMTALLAAGFNPTSDSLFAAVFSGTISGGIFGTRMTPTANPNIYSVVRVIPPGNVGWKFRAQGTSTFQNSGYESGGDNLFVLGAGTADTTLGAPGGLVPRVNLVVGLNQNEAFASSILLFPNPSTNGFINLSMKAEDRADLQINVVNMLGQVVYTENRNQFVGTYNEKIDLSNLATGVYSIQIRLGDGIYVARFINN